MHLFFLPIVFAESTNQNGWSSVFVTFVVIFTICCLCSMVGPERDHHDFMTRFKAYYPGAEVVETFHCSVVIKRDSKFFRITINEEGKFCEETYQPFTESVLS